MLGGCTAINGMDVWKRCTLSHTNNSPENSYDVKFLLPTLLLSPKAPLCRCHHSSPSDFDEWETLGNPGWNYASLLPYFKKSQSLVPSEAWPNAKIVDPKHRRGRTGPLKVGYSFISALSSAFITASGALGIKIRDDLNTDYEGSGTLGISRAQTFISEGCQLSPSLIRKAFLEADILLLSSTSLHLDCLPYS